jgi:hypothetical protein
MVTADGIGQVVLKYVKTEAEVLVYSAMKTGRYEWAERGGLGIDRGHSCDSASAVAEDNQKESRRGVNAAVGRRYIDSLWGGG